MTDSVEIVKLFGSLSFRVTDPIKTRAAMLDFVNTDNGPELIERNDIGWLIASMVNRLLSEAIQGQDLGFEMDAGALGPRLRQGDMYPRVGILAEPFVYPDGSVSERWRDLGPEDPDPEPE